MKKCPKCNSTYRMRIKRNGLLKKIPFVKAYRCEKCFTKYLVTPLTKKTFCYEKNKSLEST